MIGDVLKAVVQMHAAGCAHGFISSRVIEVSGIGHDSDGTEQVTSERSNSKQGEGGTGEQCTISIAGPRKAMLGGIGWCALSRWTAWTRLSKYTS